MRRRLRIGVISVGVLVLIVGLVGVGIYQTWMRSGLPQREGEARLAGLSSSVEIAFDRWGVPHVDAASGRDLAAALGWLHANDRMTQLELGRRAAAGRLSEIFGEATLDVDIEMRTLRIRRVAERLAASASPESRTWLDGYADGVNAWLRHRADDLPPTLALFGVEPEPWTPTDSFAFAALMFRDLSFWQGRPEELRFRWLVELGPERALELLPGAVELPDAIAELAANSRVEGQPSEREGDSPGSNNWAIGPEWTESGAPIVAGDPHLGLRLPSVWYQASLSAPGYRAAGWTLPGLPGVVIGQAADVAWSLTNVMLDDHDLVFEDLDERGDRARRGDEWIDVRRTVERIAVAGGESVDLELLDTIDGPMLPADSTSGLPPRTLLWTAYEGGDPLAALVGVARSGSVEDVLAAIGGFVGPAQNIVVADSAGDVGWGVLGRRPRRLAGDGLLPVPGWSGGFGWAGLEPAETSPRIVDQKNGLLVTANARIPGAEYGPGFTADFDLPFRADRIREMLDASRSWTPDSTAIAQSDRVDSYALELVSRLVGELSGDAARARQFLSDWSGDTSDGGQMALFVAAEQALAELIFGDDLDLAAVSGQSKRRWLLRVLRGEMSAVWFDRRDTEAVEGPAEIVQLALSRAWTESAPDYDDVHWLDLRHPLGQLPLIGSRFDRRRLAVGGSPTTVAAFGGPWDEGRRPVTYGPSMRWVASPGLGDEALAVLPGGQSGHPGDAHFDDQLSLYLEGRMKTAPWSEAAIEAATVSRLVLLPDC